MTDFVTPTGPGPLQDKELYEALEAAVVGVTGLPGNLVRPRWQAEPSLIPPAATCWIALGVTDRKADTFPYLDFFPPNNPASSYQMQRSEELTMLASVYDLGYGGQADAVAAVLRDGLMIPQNGQALAEAGLYVVSDADIALAPTLFKQRWMYRVDLAVRFRRMINRSYATEPTAGAGFTLYTDDGQPPRQLRQTVPPPSWDHGQSSGQWDNPGQEWDQT